MWVISNIIFYVSTLSEMCVISHAFVINVYSKTFLDLYTKDIVGSEILNINFFVFFISNALFSTQPQCCLITIITIIAHNHHQTETHFIFIILVSMFWSRSIYVVIHFSIFSLIFIIIDHTISLKKSHLFLKTS